MSFTIDERQINYIFVIFEFFRKLLGFSQQMRARIQKDIRKKPAVKTAGRMRGFHLFASL